MQKRSATICPENSRLNRWTQKRRASQTISFVESRRKSLHARTLNDFSSFLCTQQKWTPYLLFHIQRFIWYTRYFNIGKHGNMTGHSEHSVALLYASFAYHALIKQTSLSISTAFLSASAKKKGTMSCMLCTRSQWMLRRPKSVIER